VAVGTTWIWRAELLGLVEQCNDASLSVRLSLYSLVYVTLASLAIPGAVLLTVLAGPLFGVLLGTITASLLSTLGASLAFLGSRYVLWGRPVVGRCARPGPPTGVWTGRAAEATGIGVWDLLFLRLIPVVPYFALNLLAGRSELSLGRFWFASQFGMLPATFLLVRWGAVVSAPSGLTGRQSLATLWPLLVIAPLVATARGWLAMRQRQRSAIVCVRQSDPDDGNVRPTRPHARPIHRPDQRISKSA